MLDAGVRDVRNQGVLLDGVNADPDALLDLCFALLDGAQVMPYYFYMCDMIPFSEHWRVSVADAQRLQHHLMGYLPGFATPRIVCDVPFVGKRWVHQLADYDHEHGISYWTKNYRTSIEAADPEALTRTYAYYDPIHTLPQAGQDWWRAARRRHPRRGVAFCGRLAGRRRVPEAAPPGLTISAEASRSAVPRTPRRRVLRSRARRGVASCVARTAKRLPRRRTGRLSTVPAAERDASAPSPPQNGTPQRRAVSASTRRAIGLSRFHRSDSSTSRPGSAGVSGRVRSGVPRSMSRATSVTVAATSR